MFSEKINQVKHTNYNFSARMGVAENQIGQVVIEIEEMKQNLQNSSQEVYKLFFILFSSINVAFKSYFILQDIKVDSILEEKTEEVNLAQKKIKNITKSLLL